MRHMEDFGYEQQAPAERERAAWRMGYQAGRTDERMRQWRRGPRVNGDMQTSGPTSEEAEPLSVAGTRGEV